MFIPIQQLHLAQQVNNNFFFSILEIFGKQINRVSFFEIKTNSHQIHYSASQDVYSNSAGNQFLYFTLWLELIRLSNISGQLFLLKCQF